jgi:DnaJ domain
MFIILGLIAAGLIWWGIKNYGDDEALVKKLRQGSGILTLGFAVVLLLKGRIDMAVGLAGLGFWLLSGSVAGLFHPQANGGTTARGEADQGNGNTRGSQHGASTGLTKEEAYEVLGLKSGASEEAILQAHRELIKKIHPDQGGSTYLAARVNQARDRLLSQ